MHNFVKALSLAVALSAVSAAEAHAQFTARLPGGAASSSTVYGSRGGQGGYGSSVIDRRLQPYLEGITITRGQDVGIERAWESYGSLDQRLDAVRGVLTRTQQHRFDQNRADLAYNSGYNNGQYGTNGRSSGGYGQGSYGRGGYGQGSRSGSYGDRDGQYQRQRDEAQAEEARREAARRDEYQREQQQRAAGQYRAERDRSERDRGQQDRGQQGRQRGNSASHRNDDHDRRDH